MQIWLKQFVLWLLICSVCSAGLLNGILLIWHKNQRIERLFETDVKNQCVKLIIPKSQYGNPKSGDEIYFNNNKYDIATVKEAGTNWEMTVWEDDFEREIEDELLGKKPVQKQNHMGKITPVFYMDWMAIWNYDVSPKVSVTNLFPQFTTPIKKGFPESVFQPPGATFI